MVSLSSLLLLLLVAVLVLVEEGGGEAGLVAAAAAGGVLFWFLGLVLGLFFSSFLFFRFSGLIGWLIGWLVGLGNQAPPPLSVCLLERP